MTNWTAFTITPIYNNNDRAENTTFSFWLASGTPTDHADIDDLTLSYTTGTNEIINAKFPSAVLINDQRNSDKMLYLDILGSESAAINVYDVNGKNIYANSVMINNHAEVSIPSSTFATGIYMCKITGTSFGKTIRFNN